MRLSAKREVSFDILEQYIPTDVESPAQADQNRERATEVPCLEHLQVTGRDVGLFGQSFLSQASRDPQSAQIASENIELFLRNALHG